MARKPAPKTRTTSKDLPEPTPSALTFHPEFDRLFKDGVRSGLSGYEAMRRASDLRMHDAEDYGRALVSTCNRYFAGMMQRPTWDRHMQHLWSTIEAKGLRDIVVKLVLPKLTAGGAR